MDPLEIVKKSNTIGVHFDPNTDKLYLEGRSQPEDVRMFFNPILQWLDQYVQLTKGPVELVFKLDYFNTASAKIIVEILLKMSNLHSKGIATEVKWFYEPYDEDMKEVVLQLIEITGIEIKAIPRKTDQDE